MKAMVNEDCTGCGVCENICPEVFELVGEMAQVKVDPIPEDAEDSCREAAEACPVDAIVIEEKILT